MPAAFLTAVLSPGVQARVAFAAHHLIAVELLGECLEGWLNNATTKTQH